MKEIDPIQLQQLLREERVFLLDVREPYEREAFHIGGELIPLNEVVRHADSIPRDVPVVVYCRKGIRSQLAIQRLEERFGFTNLINLRGGLEGWKEIR